MYHNDTAFGEVHKWFTLCLPVRQWSNFLL